MALNDLGSFLKALEERNDLVRIPIEMDPAREVGSVAYLTLGGPAVLFEKVKGCSLPLAINFLNTRQKIALAAGTSEKNLLFDMVDAMEHPVQPAVVKTGPCKQNKVFGDDIDLAKWPVGTWNDEDAGPYMGFHGNITKDVETGIQNVGIYRMQVKGPRQTGIFVSERQNIGRNYLVAKAHGHKYLEMAVAFGGDPLLTVAATTPLEYGIDEYGFVGGLRKAPVEMVPCETVDLVVPASADVVFEGKIWIGMEKEGPFGEFTGFYSGVMEHPVFELDCITWKDDAIFTNTYQREYPAEGPVVSRAACAPAILWKAKKIFPGLVSVNQVVTQRIVIASIKKGYEGEHHTAANAILSTQMGKFTKVLIIVDEDVDPYDYEQVWWALHTRYDPEFDTYITPRMPGHGLDPSERPVGGRGIDSGGVGCLTSLIVIDATQTLARPFMGHRIQPPAVVSEVENKLRAAGIDVRNPRASTLRA